MLCSHLQWKQIFTIGFFCRKTNRHWISWTTTGQLSAWEEGTKIIFNTNSFNNDGKSQVSPEYYACDHRSHSVVNNNGRAVELHNYLIEQLLKTARINNLGPVNKSAWLTPRYGQSKKKCWNWWLCTKSKSNSRYSKCTFPISVSFTKYNSYLKINR